MEFGYTRQFGFPQQQGILSPVVVASSAARVTFAEEVEVVFDEISADAEAVTDAVTASPELLALP